ncbi:MAG: hypothetical protein HUU56_16725 [Bdellovibrionaceae bacterium]|nr:hypothetical protein [Pseudobdellovibrionaceae bacterium]
MKFFLIIIIVSFHTIYVNANQCHTYYSKQSVMQKDPVDLVESFQVYSAKNPGFFNLTLANFLDLQIESLIKDYTEQMQRLELVGTDSPLKSNLNLIEISYKQVTEKLALVDGLSNPSSLRKFLNFSSGLQKKLNSAVVEFQICKGKFEKCHTDLKSAVEETSNHQVKLEKLITKLKSYQNELSIFLNYLEQNDSSLGVSDVIIRSAEPIIRSHVNRINEMLILSEKVLLVEAQNISLAIFNLKNLLPTLNQGVKETIQRGAPKELEEKIDNSTDEELKVSSAKHAKAMYEIKAAVEQKFDDNAVLDIIQKNVNSMGSISLEEAVYILTKVPLNVNWGFHEGDSKSILFKNLKTEWSGFTPVELLIAYQLLRIVHVEKDTSKRKIEKFVGFVNKILSSHIKGKKDQYVSEISQEFAKHLAKFYVDDNK